MTKNIEDYKNQLSDKINSMLRKRQEDALALMKMDEELKVLIEQQYALDDTKVRIFCMPAPLGCNGKGYIEGEDGKKHQCPVCGGPDKPYIWATLYQEPKK